VSPDPPPVIFDTDGGVDDCTALWWGLAAGEVDVVAVTTVAGNVPLEQVNRNIAKVLHAAGRADIPIAVGVAEPIGPAPVIPSAQAVHGDDGLGGVGHPDVDFEPVAEPAPALIARLAAERPGELTLVAVGPFGNVALALRRSPEIVTQLRDVVVMGGMIRAPGNALPLGEFNVVFDPQAAAEMVDAPWAHPPLLVPGDVTYATTLSETELALLEERRSPAARFLAGPIAGYRQTGALQSVDGGCPSHDTVALMAVADPELVDSELLPLAVDLGGSAAWGTTVVDLRAQILTRHDLPPELLDVARAAMFDGKAAWRIGLTADTASFRARMRALFGEAARVA
jgi:purine nucleosidase